MYNFPIGVILESFRTDRSTAIQKAAAMGANRIQMYTTTGENSPEKLSSAAQRAILNEVKDSGMVFSALCDIGCKGFLTIEREVGTSPQTDIKTAYNFLKDIIANN
ncbi:MAG: hypothetical protein UHM23_07405 [Clostridia bacterium]|nr:hypothetical protein [Clostridia bacterium]